MAHVIGEVVLLALGCLLIAVLFLLTSPPPLLDSSSRLAVDDNSANRDALKALHELDSCRSDWPSPRACWAHCGQVLGMREMFGKRGVQTVDVCEACCRSPYPFT